MKTMLLGADDRLFVLTGAGVSAESGLATFRDSGGLWSGFRVEQVATPEAWQANPARVWDFYSMRRRDARAAQPNAAHVALAELEHKLGDRFFLCTQNVDDLHERAGSHRVHHMHGSLFESRCVACDQPFPDEQLYPHSAAPSRAGLNRVEQGPEGLGRDGLSRNHRDRSSGLALPACKKCGAPVRPHIVWFGEIPLDMDLIYAELARASILLVVGTSGSVYPAAGFVEIARARRIRAIYIGPEPPLNAHSFDQVILGSAVNVLPTLLHPSLQVPASLD